MNMGPRQAANFSGEIVWMANVRLSAPQRGISNDQHPSCLFCGTGADAGGTLSRLHVVWVSLSILRRSVWV